MIRTENLTKRFGSVTAVDSLSLAVARGELYGLVGADGAGKTTTMRLLAGLMAPTSGDAWTAGHHTVGGAGALKEEIAYMGQRFGLYTDLTVLENVHFYADLYGVARAGRDEAVDRLLSFSDLTDFKRRRAGKLSGGMKQKLSLVCALVHTPKVLLLDEPTNGVDPVSRRDFWRILHHLLREGVTIFVSTAYLDEAERCARLALMDRGALLAQGSPAEVKRLLSGALLEVRAPVARKAAAALRKALPDARVGVFGDRVHVPVGDAETGRAELAAVLRSAGIDADIQTITPSLEDIFVSSIDRGARREAQ